MWDFLVSKPKHYTSEDVHGAVIASTLAILERIKMNVEKASLPVNISKEKELLESLGLTSSKNMQVIKEAEAKINVHNSIIEDNARVIKIMEEMYKLFGNNTFYLPMKDFIAILDKYNLAAGRLEDYKGTIPETNLEEIAKAKQALTNLKDNAKVYDYSKPKTEYKYESIERLEYGPNGTLREVSDLITHKIPSYEYQRMEDLYPTLRKGIDRWYRITEIWDKKFEEQIQKRFPMVRDYHGPGFRVDFEEHHMLIAAPIQEMNTHYEFRERIITDDPIVFSTIGNGVIIYSMWGDEGNDEVLRKYQELNKFIAENVNLGTLTESKEALS